MTVSNVRIVARIEFSDYSAWLLIKLARPHSIIPVLWLVMMLWYHLAISFLRNLSEVGQFLGGSFGSVYGLCISCFNAQLAFCGTSHTLFQLLFYTS